MNQYELILTGNDLLCIRLKGAIMREREPETQTMKISEVKAKLSSLVNEVYRKERRILVEKAGIPVAAMISVNDLERLNQFEREWRERFAVFEEMREAFKDIPPDQIERDVAAIVREIRDEEEAKRRAGEAMAERRLA